ncbi:MAG: hypothetical protein JNL74_09985, partial [Fibrobacteres bacterium]|nr:hypothetical protein [Fibrobacterota bacterium]
MNIKLQIIILALVIILPIKLIAAPTALPMKVMAQIGKATEFAPMCKGIDTSCNTAIVPTLVSAPLHGTISLVASKSWCWFPTGAAGTPRPWTKLPVTWFQYTSTGNFTGLDSFTYNVNYGNGVTNTEKCIVRVHPKEPGGMMVLLVVNDQLMTSLPTEINRLKTDLENEGYTSRIMTYANTLIPNTNSINDTNLCKALWDSLRNEYNKPNQMMAGAILLGRLPLFKGSTYVRGPVASWDDPFWNMSDWIGSVIQNGLYLIGHDSTANDTTYSGYGLARGMIGANQRHIWVTRFWALNSYGSGPLTYGSELTLMKRMLDANHDYRTGASRYPHTAWALSKSPNKAYFWDPAKLSSVWPNVVNMNLLPNQAKLLPEAYYSAGDYLDLNTHGSAAYYTPSLMSGTLLRSRMYADSAMSRPFQIRYLTPSACHTSDPGAITNAHLYSRGGGCIFSTGAGEYVATDGYLGLAHDYPPFKAKMRTMLSEGERWGRAWVSSGMPITGGLFYGDGSLKPMMFPSNEIPSVTAIAATSLGAKRMRINVTATDADGSLTLYEYWINRKYNLGRNEPDSVGAALSQFEKVFDSVTTVHLEVMDNYKARTTVEFTVVPDSGIRLVSGLSVSTESIRPIAPVSSLSIHPN